MPPVASEGGVTDQVTVLDWPGPIESKLAAVPYFAWANRTPGAMRVWVPRRPAGST